MKPRLLTALAAAFLLLPAFALTAAPASADVCTITGTGAPDILAGTRLPDTICADDGDDLIRAKDGGDVIFAGGGNDKIAPGPGSDFVWGELGTQDLVQFTGATGPITADLSAGTATGQGTDALNGVEGLAGATYGDDFTGDGGDNKLSGGAGNDTIAGGVGGADMLLGQAGDDDMDVADGSGGDTLQGGAGTDTCTADPGDVVKGCEITPLPSQSTLTTLSYTDPSVVLDDVTVTATVSAGFGTPTGSVTFYLDDINVGSSPLDGSGEAQFLFNTPTVGASELEADYTGGPGFYPSSTDSGAYYMVGNTGPDCGSFQGSPVGTTDADIRGCDVGDGLFINGGNWSGTDARLAALTNSTVIFSQMQNVNFQSANLFSTQFANVQMQGSDFAFANLTDVQFSGANLNGAINMGAATGINSVAWQGATCPDGSISSLNGDTCIGHL